MGLLFAWKGNSFWRGEKGKSPVLAQAPNVRAAHCARRVRVHCQSPRLSPSWHGGVPNALSF